jgi:hypothetical protein
LDALETEVDSLKKAQSGLLSDPTTSFDGTEYTREEVKSEVDTVFKAFRSLEERYKQVWEELSQSEQSRIKD